MDTHTYKHACTHIHTISYATIASRSWGTQVVSNSLCRYHLRTLLILTGPLMSTLIPKCLSCPCCYSFCYCCHEALHKHIYSRLQNLLLLWVTFSHYEKHQNKTTTKKGSSFYMAKIQEHSSLICHRKSLKFFFKSSGCLPFYCHQDHSGFIARTGFYIPTLCKPWNSKWHYTVYQGLS